MPVLRLALVRPFVTESDELRSNNS
jgi:hypothetical protein